MSKEKVKIEYEKWSLWDLFSTWVEDESEMENLMKETGITKIQIDKIVNENDEIERDDMLLSIHNELVKYASNVYFKLCYGCSDFVEENYYINKVEMCVECASERGT